MKRRFLVLYAILGTLLFNSCNVDDGVNFHYVPLKVVSVDLPESFNLNEVYKVNVTYLRSNSCTYFEGFDIQKEAQTTRKVVIVGSELDDDKGCTTLDDEVVASFNFEVLYQDPYLFRFWTGEDENGDPQYLEIEVPVNQ